jgi:hypothetical protein
MFARVLGAVSHGIKAIGKYASPVARFIGKYHAPLTQVAHGLAMASGNETAQKITGAAMAVSNMATMRQKLSQQNQAARTEMGAGGRGVYNAQTGKMSNYG